MYSGTTHVWQFLGFESKPVLTFQVPEFQEEKKKEETQQKPMEEEDETKQGEYCDISY